MRLKVLACDVLRREVYTCAARAACICDVTLLPQGLHDDSDACRATLQPLVEETDPDRYDAVLLGYGLCNNAIDGVRAAGVPLVVPRAHDCITLLLGSKERYAALFEEAPGTYWFSSGWLECRQDPDVFDADQQTRLRDRARYDEIAAKYGEENARYVMEVLGGWEAHYTRGALIRFPFDRHLGLEQRIGRLCKDRGWKYAELEGDLGLVQAGMDGTWDDERFLRVPPGGVVRASHDGAVLTTASGAAADPPEHAP